MKIIVFGGTGWVGHNIAIDCYKAGYEVIVCSRGQKNDYNTNIPEGVRTIQADIDNMELPSISFELNNLS